MRRGPIAAAGCFALLALALFAPAFLPMKGDRLFMPLHTGPMLPWRTELPAERIAELEAIGNPEVSDKLWLVDPDTSLVVESWRRGELPTWNPSIVGGVPFLGQALYGSLYPPNALLLLIAPLERAWAWVTALHVVIAGLGTFALARRLGLSTAPALLAGVLFAAGGAVVVQFHYPTRFFAVAWVPWLLAAVHWFSEKPSLARWCAIPPPIALVILSGFPQTGLYGIVGAGLFGAWRLVARFRQQSWRPLLPFAGAFALGAALAAAQIAPVDDATKHALPRAHSSQQQIEESGTRWMLAGYVLPGAFQDPRAPWSQSIAKNPLWNGIYCDVNEQPDGRVLPSGITARPSLTESACYLGALGFVLAITALGVVVGLGGRGAPARGTRALALGLLAALALCWAYALGQPWVVRAVALLPRMDVGEVRRVVATIGLLGALLAALGAQRLLEPEARGTRRFALAAAGLVALALLALWLVVDRAGPAGLDAWLRERQLARYGAELMAQFAAAVANDAATTTAIHEFVRGRLASGAAWFGAALVVLVVVHQLVERGWRRTAAALLLLAAAADLGALHFRVNPFVPSEGFLAQDPLLAPLATEASGGRVRRFAPDFELGRDSNIEKLVLPPNLGARFGIDDGEGYLVMLPVRIARFLRALEPEERAGQTVVTVGALPLRSVAGLRSPLLDAYSVSRILTQHDLATLLADSGGGLDPEGGFELVAERGETRVYANREALPFAVVLPEAWFLPEAPPDDDIAVPIDAGAPDPADAAAVQAAKEAMLAASPARVERLALHQAALRELATRNGLVRRCVFLEAVPPAGAATSALDVERDGVVEKIALPRFTTVGLTANVVAIERTPQRIVIRLDGLGAGFLLVNEGFDPGWRATIDGAAAAVVPANVAFRGVVLPQGAREVVLEYRPRAVTIGLWISGGALFVLVAAIAAAAVRARISGARARPSGSPNPGAAAPAG